MKLARTTRFVTYSNDLNRVSRDGRRPTRSTTRAFSTQRAGRLIARWHVCPETHRLECSWSLEPVACDDQLCRSSAQRRRNNQLHRYRFLTVAAKHFDVRFGSKADILRCESYVRFTPESGHHLIASAWASGP